MAKTALAVKGKECIAIVESAYTAIVNGDMDSASEKLKHLENDAGELAREAEKKAKEIEEVEKQYKQKAEEMQQKISELHIQAITIKSRQSEWKLTLKNQEKKLLEHQKELADAESKLSDAESKLRRVKKKKKKKKGFLSAVGAIVGTAIAPGVGTVLGAGAGHVLGSELHKDNVDHAAARVKRAKAQCDDCHRDIDSTKAQISSFTSKINTLENEIQDLERQRSQYDNEATRMKEVMLFFVRASHFWKEFKQISDHGADRTAILQGLINKAKEMENLTFLKNRGSERAVMTFLEAWELMEEKYMEKSEFEFQIL